MNAKNLCVYLCEQYEASGLCGSWLYDPVSGTVKLSPGLEKMLGLPPDHTIHNFEDFRKLIHPDDLAIFKDLQFDFIQNAQTERQWEITRSDNRVIKVRVRIDQLKENGITWMVGILWDLSAKEFHSTRGESDMQTRLQLTEEIADAGTWEFDLSAKQLSFSPNMNRIFSNNPHNPIMVEQFFHSAVDEDKPIARRVVDAIATGSVPVDEIFRIQSGQEIKTIRVKAIQSAANPHLVTGVGIDITPIRLAEKDLRETQHSLLQKDNFIRIASHELKTPISSLHGYVQLLLRLKAPDEEFLQRSLQAVDRQVLNLNKLLDALLDVSASARGNLVLQYKQFNIYDLIEESVLFLQPSISQALILRGESEHWIMADKERINQVVVNIVGNATKYSPKDKPIFIHVKGDAKTVRITIQDSGPGIPEDEREKIFGKFYRVQNSKYATIDGFGIGLYICAEIIHQHKGKIWVENSDEGGAMFCFTIPKQRWSGHDL